MSEIVVNKVVKEYVSREGTTVRALDSVSFEAAAGGITSIVGPTGSGKSTVLRILCGLDQADEGTVHVGGQTPDGLKGRIGFMTQRHTLFPWMRVRENIGLPLLLKNIPENEAGRRVTAICGQLGLAGAGDLYPYELSGGMMQRAALGRLLATDSRLWLMDEPFAALDERSRHQLQLLLIELVRERGLSVLFVTHSIDEAVYLADRVVVLSAGPGRVVETVDIAEARPRNRLSPSYGSYMEKIRTSIESVL